jgi:hypothetical protein
MNLQEKGVIFLWSLAGSLVRHKGFGRFRDVCGMMRGKRIAMQVLYFQLFRLLRISSCYGIPIPVRCHILFFEICWCLTGKRIVSICESR